jgi:hypothetical protein
VPEPGRLDELHLYHGSKCNRACAFCCVNGAPEGSHAPFTEATLKAAVNLVARHGSIKIYGGEPTLDAENLLRTVRQLRAPGFEGPITIFSNGLRSRVLTKLLDEFPKTYVVLNHAIVTGNGEKPLPTRTFAHLAGYHAAHPNRIFLSHDFVVPVGRGFGSVGVVECGSERVWEYGSVGVEECRSEGVTAYGSVEVKQTCPSLPHPHTPILSEDNSSPSRSSCYRCHPVLTSSGQYHGCPFAVEVKHRHFVLGDENTPAATVRERYSRFIRWIDQTLEPEAARQGRDACAVCAGSNPPAFYDG